MSATRAFLINLGIAIASGAAALLLYAAVTHAQVAAPNQAYTTLPNGTLQNSAGQNVGRWERDASGTVRFRDARNGQLSTWSVVPKAGGGSTYVPSPFEMPPRHPGLP